MLKLFSKNILAVQVNAIHSSSVCGRWYLSRLRSKAPAIPKKNPPKFDFDWENERSKLFPKDQLISEVTQIPEFNSLNESVKLAFSYGFQPISKSYKDEQKQLLEKFGYSLSDQNIATDVINLTVKLRYYKFILDQNPKHYTLRCATEALVHRRYRALRHLRARNIDEFKRITEGLGIEKFVHVTPMDKMELDEINRRTKEVSAETYKTRLGKLAHLKATLLKERAAFFEEEKPAKLDQVKKLLRQLSDKEIESAKLDELMKSLFSEIVEERQMELLKAPMKDKLEWYRNEELQREKVMRIIAEKASRRMSQKR